ncbi:hypothetical protein Cma02nite_25310 [Cellulomonas marina]|nr:hypothetical protein Cma02nite_25310 [Cellulomonas marina]
MAASSWQGTTRSTEAPAQRSQGQPPGGSRRTVPSCVSTGPPSGLVTAGARRVLSRGRAVVGRVRPAVAGPWRVAAGAQGSRAGGGHDLQWPRAARPVTRTEGRYAAAAAAGCGAARRPVPDP